jgi:hypothetical protein
VTLSFGDKATMTAVFRTRIFETAKYDEHVHKPWIPAICPLHFYVILIPEDHMTGDGDPGQYDHES